MKSYDDPPEYRRGSFDDPPPAFDWMEDTWELAQTDVHRTTADMADDIAWDMNQRGLKEYPIHVLQAMLMQYLDDHNYVIAVKRRVRVAEPVDQVDLDKFGNANEFTRQAAETAGKLAVAGWVYYLHVGERLKIGYTSSPEKRLKSYPPGSRLIAIHPGTKATETDMHQRFRHALVDGREWFNPDDLAIREHITEVLKQFGPPPEQYQPRYRSNTAAKVKPKGWTA